ncbi:hypothetical protein JVU11DRAFT_10993 [Chiua virens]|nr:hypothetical protein JVU11DRAFT_10993 [Chiua virens]
MDVDRPEVDHIEYETRGHHSHSTQSTSVGVKMEPKSIEHPQKKAKTEMCLPSIAPDPVPESSNSVLANSVSSMQKWTYDKDGYIVDVIKKWSDYVNKDPPMPSDHHWSRSFIPTATLWCSIQNNVWNIPDNELVAALQTIFRTVYPDVKYCVTASGSVFSLMSQRVSEWRSGIGFTALDDADTIATAEYLATDYRFLRKDQDAPIGGSELDGLFRSPFLLELIARTHLVVASSDLVEIPGWDMRAVAGRKNGAGVVALAAVALECAVTLIARGDVDVEKVLVEWAGGAKGKNKIKLPKVLNLLMGCKTSAPYQFSSTNWASDMAAYKESIQRRGVDFVKGTFAAARALKHPKNGSVDRGDLIDSPHTAPNPCAFLCKSKIAIFFFFVDHLTYVTDLL